MNSCRASILWLRFLSDGRPELTGAAFRITNLIATLMNLPSDSIVGTRRPEGCYFTDSRSRLSPWARHHIVPSLAPRTGLTSKVGDGGTHSTTYKNLCCSFSCVILHVIFFAFPAYFRVVLRRNASPGAMRCFDGEHARLAQRRHRALGGREGHRLRPRRRDGCVAPGRTPTGPEAHTTARSFGCAPGNTVANCDAFSPWIRCSSPPNSAR